MAEVEIKGIAFHIKENHRNNFGLDNDAHDFLHCSAIIMGNDITPPSSLLFLERLKMKIKMMTLNGR